MKVNSNAVSLSDENFETEVLRSITPVMVEIGADWCGACHIMAPILEKLAAIYKGQIKFGELDIETSEKLSREYGVSELPILLFFKNGQIVDHVIGTASKRSLENKLQALMRT